MKNRFKELNLNQNTESMKAAAKFVATALIAASYGSIAYGFDLDAGVAGAINPIIETINNHFGKGLVAAGATGMFLAQGDLRTRAMGAGLGVTAGGLVMAGIKLALNV